MWRGTIPRSIPPVVPGLPVLGNAVALGKGGLAFISQCRQQVTRPAARQAVPVPVWGPPAVKGVSERAVLWSLVTRSMLATYV